jgi:hypothetical protein
MNHSLQHPDTVPSNELYYPQDEFDFLLQASSSQFPRFPFQPQPSPLGPYIGHESSFETLRTYHLNVALVCTNLLKSTICTRGLSFCKRTSQGSRSSAPS